MKKKTAAAAIIALSIALGGCSGNDISLTDSAGKTEVEVSWWGSDDRSAYTMSALREYEAQNPNIKVKMTYGEFSGFEKKNDVKMFSKNAADIMQLNYAWVEKYQKQGLSFYDMNKLKDYIDLSAYSEDVLSYGRNANGEQVGLPVALNVDVGWYNKSIYDSYGLSIPTTWQDLFDAAEVMKADGIYPVDMEAGVIWQSCVAYVEQTTGHTVFDESNQFNFSLEDVTLMMSFYQSLVDNHVVERISDRNESKIGEGLYAGTIQWVSSADKVSGLIEKAGGTTAAVLAPGSSGGLRDGWYVKPATFYAISSHTKNPTEAAKLLNYMVAGEEMTSGQKFEKGVPVNSHALSVLQGMGELKGVQYEVSQLAAEKSYPLMSPYFEIDKYKNSLKDGIDLVLYGQDTLENAAAIVYENMSVPN